MTIVADNEIGIGYDGTVDKQSQRTSCRNGSGCTIGSAHVFMLP